MPPQSRGSQTADVEHPGAGTLFVHDSVQDKRKSVIGRSRSRTPVRLRPSSTSRERKKLQERKWPLDWDDVREIREDPTCSSATEADVWLERGIGDYTFLPAPEGLLGKGKFSSVYKVSGPDGTIYALKHTPLHPHHPLIAARLLREPTLLAQLPPHPCLVHVEGWIRTEGHFYLIEKYAASHIPLQLHPLPLKPSRAAYILDQLVSVVRDCMHRGRVCHRDLKGENVLVDVETGDIVVLDLGLATQFSASEPKLTTCCGSPAFHSPEIVNALNHPPGAVTYYGPELDIWCIALTLLSLLLSTRFPLGPSHRSRHTMSSRVLDRLQELDLLYPPDKPSKQWRLTPEEHEMERKEWGRVKVAMKGFLEMDGKRRMEKFRQYKFGKVWRHRSSAWMKEEGGLDPAGQARTESTVFKQLSFLPSPVKYTLPLSVLLPTSPSTSTPKSQVAGGTDSAQTSAEESTTHIVLANPTHESDRRVLSYLKYLLRTHGILYHCISASTSPLFQLVVPLATTGTPYSPSSHKGNPEVKRSWSPFDIFHRTRPASIGRSASTPAKRSEAVGGAQGDESTGKKGTVRYLRCYIQIEYDHPLRTRATSHGRSRINAASERSRTHTPRPRLHRQDTSTSTASRSTSLAPTFVSRVRTRRDMSPSTGNQHSPGEAGQSLAVASLQQALLQIETQANGITGSSEPRSGSEKKVLDRPGWLSMPTSPRLGLTDLPLTESVQPDPHSPDSSPSTSIPNTPTDPVPTPRPPQKRPSQAKRASSSPRLSTRGLPPVSPSLTLSPLPNMTPAFPLSPLSRQVSLTSSPFQESGGGQSRAVSRQSSGRQLSYSSSRHPSRLPSRAPSRAASGSSASISSPCAQNLQATSRVTSLVSSPTSSDPGTKSSGDRVPSASISSGNDSGLAPPASEPISTVNIRLSDPRAYPALYKAFNQPHIHPVPFSPVSTGQGGSGSGTKTKHKLLSEDITEAIGVPIIPLAGKGGQYDQEAEEEEEEEERGRPRSRETPSSVSSGGTRIGLGLGVTTSHAATDIDSSAKAISVSVRETEQSPVLQRRELSAGRRLMSLVGLGQGQYQHQPAGRAVSQPPPVSPA